MPWYPRIQAAIKRVFPLLLPTQATNLALLVSVLLAKRSSCLSELVRAYPVLLLYSGGYPHPSTTSCIASSGCGASSTIRASTRRRCNFL